MRSTLTTTQNQQLTITPQLQQAIRLLQLSSQALELEINTLLDKNPFLELDQESSRDLPEKHLESDHLIDSLEYGSRPKNLSDNAQEYQEWLTNRSSETTLRQHLIWQLTMGNFSEAERLLATLLIEEINDDGYLATPLEEVQISFIQQYPEHEVFTLADIEVILQKIQRFDPVGVGARTLIECLSIQLIALPKNRPWLREAIHALQHVELLAKRDYARLKKELNLEDEGMGFVIKILKGLNPKPGRNWSTEQKVDYILPDLMVRKKNGRFTVELNMNTLPKLRMNADYISLMNRKGTSRSNAILKEHFNEARAFLNSLKHRQETLLKVSQHIIDYQQDFFEYGANKLRPLILQSIADACGFHESTVSRITTHKYIDSPRGVFELKYFFSASACENQKTGEAAYSTKAIQAQVKKIIEVESPTNPFTDDTIMKMLASEGIHISRRTVTKYREKMKIPSSHERRYLNVFNDVDSRRIYGNSHSNNGQTVNSDAHSKK